MRKTDNALAQHHHTVLVQSHGQEKIPRTNRNNKVLQQEIPVERHRPVILAHPFNPIIVIEWALHGSQLPQ